MKRNLGLLCLLVLAGLGWVYRDSFSLQDVVQAVSPDKGSAAVGVHKCVVDGKVLYTDDLCPSGALKQPVIGGSVTVIEGQSVASRIAAAAPAASVPNARDLLVGPEGARIKDKRMDEIIGK